MSYAELHCLSNFSFLRGASRPEELVKRADELGYSALAITDECSLAGVVRAHEAAKDLKISLIIGSEFSLEEGQKIILLALNREGYAQLSTLITLARRRVEKGSYQLWLKDLDENLEDCICILSPKLSGDHLDITDADTHLFHHYFGNRLYLSIERHYSAREELYIKQITQLSESTSIPIVATGDVHMHKRSRRALQDVLTAIRINKTVATAGYALFSNGERHLRSIEQLKRLYDPLWIANGLAVATRCDFSLTALRYEYPDDLVPTKLSATQYLRILTEKGMRHYWGTAIPKKVKMQVEYELNLIAELRYEHFFLTVYDIVQFARRQGILCQGRGSAANSAVCYCLHITAVDPARSNMLFERFISKERNEPPDIDVDFESARREEVMQYIYKKYGRHRAALAASLITYRRKSALRDVGKALGLNLDQVNRLSDNLLWWEKGLAEERLLEAGFSADNPVIKKLIYLVNEIIGFPRHLSQHVGGFVIARDNLSRLVPIENASMEGRSVIQWDKEDLESLGLLKVDCLSLGMLSAIKRSFILLNQHFSYQYNLANIPAEDPAVYRMLQQADTIGVFQIESRAQMNMLPRLKPGCFYDLVVEIALVRPGPIQGEMVHPYIKRRNGLEKTDYPSKELKPVLERTLGIPIFQEQVMSIAIIAAGFSAGAADQLRRAMAAWGKKGDLEKFREQLIEGMLNNGYSLAFAEKIFHMIKGFGAYGFPESHSASFALLAYVSSWLKYYHPAVFCCALLNSQPMGFYSPSQLIQDAKRHNVTVLPIDICYSQWESSIEVRSKKSPDLRLGLNLVKGLSQASAERIVAVVQAKNIKNIEALLAQVAIKKNELDALVAADALRSLAGHRHQAGWRAMGIEKQTGLFADLPPTIDTDTQLPRPLEAQEIIADYASTGLTLRRHPLALLRQRFERAGWLSSADINRCKNNSFIQLVGLVVNRQHPNAGGTIFLTLEDEFGNANIVVWPRLVKQYTKEVVHGRLLTISGKLERESGTQHVVANKIDDYSAWLGRLETESRDFH